MEFCNSLYVVLHEEKKSNWCFVRSFSERNIRLKERITQYFEFNAEMVSIPNYLKFEASMSPNLYIGADVPSNPSCLCNATWLACDYVLMSTRSVFPRPESKEDPWSVGASQQAESTDCTKRCCDCRLAVKAITKFLARNSSPENALSWNRLKPAVNTVAVAITGLPIMRFRLIRKRFATPVVKRNNKQILANAQTRLDDTTCRNFLSAQSPTNCGGVSNTPSIWAIVRNNCNTPCAICTVNFA